MTSAKNMQSQQSWVKYGPKGRQFVMPPKPMKYVTGDGEKKSVELRWDTKVTPRERVNIRSDEMWGAALVT